MRSGDINGEIRRALESGDPAFLDSNSKRNEPLSAGRSDESSHTQPNWPAELQPEAFYGVAGELIRLIEPHSEADSAALLVQFLIGFGNVIGPKAHFMAEADRHFTNLFAVIVGQTAKGRKGTAWGQIKRILATADATWSTTRNTSGFER